MKRLFLTLLLIPALLACGNKETIPEKETIPAGDLMVGAIQSTFMGQAMNYTVWLPSNYDETKTYPFLYLLHGAYENQTCWYVKGAADKIADRYLYDGGVPMVIVMPDGQMSFYVGDYEEYMHKELMPAVEEKYHCNGKRAVAGLSMGGFGTLYNVLKYPQKFTYGYAMSPATDPDGSVALIKEQSDPSVFPPITIESGTTDGTIPIKNVRAYVQVLKENGIDCTFIERSGGHDWGFWPACLKKALVAVGRTF